ncbi:MAG: hypothetical protein AVDCRST_MAG20-2510, partial [uncultured Acidimicrobiales bacterium]
EDRSFAVRAEPRWGRPGGAHDVRPAGRRRRLLVRLVGQHLRARRPHRPRRGRQPRPRHRARDGGRADVPPSPRRPGPAGPHRAGGARRPPRARHRALPPAGDRGHVRAVLRQARPPHEGVPRDPPAAARHRQGVLPGGVAHGQDGLGEVQRPAGARVPRRHGAPDAAPGRRRGRGDDPLDDRPEDGRVARAAQAARGGRGRRPSHPARRVRPAGGGDRRPGGGPHLRRQGVQHLQRPPLLPGHARHRGCRRTGRRGHRWRRGLGRRADRRPRHDGCHRLRRRCVRHRGRCRADPGAAVVAGSRRRRRADELRPRL